MKNVSPFHPLTILISLILLLPLLVHADQLEVPEDFASIQAAIDASENGDTVLVQQGTYTENINFNGKAILVSSLLLFEQNDMHRLRTIIDGNEAGTVVTFDSGENEFSELFGLNISNGFSDGNGGGIRCADSSPRITSCFIRWNEAATRGGGISCEPDASPEIIDCVFDSNDAGSGGGGIWIGDGSNPLIEDCIFAHNTARWNGGGINMYMNCAPIISNCNFFNNSVRSKGGAIIVSQDCRAVIRGCTFEENMADDAGGAIAVERQGTADVTRCIFYDNYCSNGATLAMLAISKSTLTNCTVSWSAVEGWTYAVLCASSDLILVNTIVHGVTPMQFILDPDSTASTITISHCDISGGEESIVLGADCELNWLEGNIDETPLFGNPDNRDFNLGEASPCVDAGTDFFVWQEDTLVNLSEDEYQSLAPDMGALESEYVNGIEDIVSQPVEYALLTAYPNPFNSMTTISYALPVQSRIMLNVCDTNGRFVDVLFEGIAAAGMHSVVWDGSGLAAGVYVVQMNNKLRKINISHKIVITK